MNRLTPELKESYAERELGWYRGTIRKGMRELNSGVRIVDNFSARGRKPAEAHLPQLLDDICAIVDSQSQTDPTFHTSRLDTRLSAAEVRRQLIAPKDYTDEELPCEATISAKLNKLGYVCAKSKGVVPKKRLKRTPSLSNLRSSVRRCRTIPPSCACRWMPKP